jgi:hypothetical protein
MGSAERIRDLLPSLWRPEPGEGGLLSALLEAAGRQLDQAKIEAGDTMQAHWIPFADGAILSPYVSAFRRRAGKRPLLPGDPEVQLHPYIDDVARLAGLLGLVPFTEPLDGRETVEAFRTRVIETMRLWKDGVATRMGLLGAARLALSGMPERAVQIEEFAPAGEVAQAVATAGAPSGMVGPLMRWRTESRTLLPVPVEVYIEGVAPVPGTVDATVNPIIELFEPSTGKGNGIAYEGSVAPGKTLALLPTHTSWLGTPAGLRSATSLPAAGLPADPTAPGPWSAVAGGPPHPVRALAQAPDGAVWAAVATNAGGTLWRLSNDGWKRAFPSLPDVFCLLVEGGTLWVGHARGVARLSVFDAVPDLEPDPAGGAGPAVHALARDRAGTIWAATDLGARRVGPLGGLTAVGPGSRPGKNDSALKAVQADQDGIVHFGGEAGVFRHDPSRGSWHVYLGATIDETIPDWRPWVPASDAAPDREVFLPKVTALLRGPDQSLWIGTELGLARYRATRHRGTYATRLEAFPELGTMPVHSLAIDERQRLWAGTDRGLLVFDGHHWFQRQGAALVRLPQRGQGGSDRAWQFDRASQAWQSMLPGGPGGFRADVPPPAAVTAAGEEPIAAMLWTDGAVARIGTLSEAGFTSDAAAAPGALRRRIKPDPTRIVEGVLPAMPRLEPGSRDFRYLAIEEAVPPTPRSHPAWTREGRLLPSPNVRAAPAEGRYLLAQALRELETVFTYNPAARVTFRWRPRAPLSVTVRLERQAPDEALPAVVYDRVFASMNLVRPAGARVRLAHGEALVKGGQDG